MTKSFDNFFAKKTHQEGDLSNLVGGTDVLFRIGDRVGLRFSTYKYEGNPLPSR